MSISLRFRQHADFHRATLQMTAAGAAAGLVAHAALSHDTSPWAIGIVGAAAVVGGLTPVFARGRLAELAARLGLAAMAAAALVLLTRAEQSIAAVAAFGLLFGAGLGWGLRGWRLLSAMAVGGLVGWIGQHVFVAAVTAEQFSSMPGWLVSAGAGAAFSLVSVFALLPRHIELLRDPVVTAYQELEGTLTGEVQELVERGYGLWRKAAGELDEGDINRETLEEGVLRLFGVAHQWRSVDLAGADDQATSLVERIDALDTRIANTEDAVTANQYRQAKAALVEQLRYIKDIGVSRERVLARMHNYLAAMERLRMAVINLESTNASREAVDVQPLIANLQLIGADMDTCSEALIESEQLAGD